MTHVIVARHGGTDGLPRWEPRSAPSMPGGTSRRLRPNAAFRHGLGVSFERVEAEAHAYARRCC